MRLVRFFVVCWMLIALGAVAEQIEVRVDGIEGALRDNVRAHLRLYQARRFENLSVWRIRALSETAESEIAQALQPFGYYNPDIAVRLNEPADPGQSWVAEIRVTPGPRTRVGQTQVEISGPGQNEPEFRAWSKAWPLTPGSIIDHARYEAAKKELEIIAQRLGFFNARHLAHAITVDPEQQRADIELRFDTGERSAIGTIALPAESRFNDWLLDRLTIIEPGEAYASTRMNEQRDVLVQSGYFQRAAIEEVQRNAEGQVDLVYHLEDRLPATWSAATGYGTDTGARLQLGWLRHYLSGNGDRLNLGAGIQQRNLEWVARADYQHPYGSTPDRFLTGGVRLRHFRDNFRFRDEDKIEPVFDSIDGDRWQAQFTAGRERERKLFPERYRPLKERIFISYLREQFDASSTGGLSEEQMRLLAANPGIEPFLKTRQNSLALGVEWNLLNMRGRDFATWGEHYQLRLLGAHESLGSDTSFAQAYASVRWHWLLSDRHKLILRGEWGYTQADTTDLVVTLDDRSLNMSITSLPELYRFKTGGDRTVRGYGFEQLSTNRNGANHLLVGSAEYEFRVGEKWSLAAFTDIGNAYNDPLDPKLKRGVGVGFRWYTVIGPIQVDFAHAIDDPDSPWRLHFTIGTKLL